MHTAPVPAQLAGNACGRAVTGQGRGPAMARGEHLFTLLIPTALSVVLWHDPDTSLTPPSCPHQGCDTTGSSRSHHLLRQQVVSSSRVFRKPHFEFVGGFYKENMCNSAQADAAQPWCFPGVCFQAFTCCLNPLMVKPKRVFWGGFVAPLWPGSTQPSHIRFCVCVCVCEGAASHAPFQSLNNPKKVLDSSKLTRAILETLTCKLSIFLSLKTAPR